jgi:hypothetical protein
VCVEPEHRGVRYPRLSATRGDIMPRAHTQNHARAPAFVETRRRKRYLLVRQEDVWFIMFGGEEYGPYKTEREAKLFAIEAAHKLGEQGVETEVLVSNEAGAISPVWVYGRHTYPPRE